MVKRLYVGGNGFEPPEAKTACVFLCQIVTTDIRMKPRYTDGFWGKHPFDGDIILYKNKNKNKNKDSS